MARKEEKDAPVPETGAWSPEVRDRFKAVVKGLGGNKPAGEIAGVSDEMISRYKTGKVTPAFDTVVAVMRAGGRSLDWLTNGDAQAINQGIDDELMGRITDAIEKLYREERITLPMIDLGRLVARKYDEIVAATADPAERGAMIKLIVTQLRAELRSARAEPGTGKASA